MSSVFLRLGSEFLVNTQTVFDQRSPAITGLANGGFVVSWSDLSGTLGDASSFSIKAQLFGTHGARVGDEFLVNTQTASIQGDPKIASLANGGFVVSWADFSGSLGDSSGTSIKAQLFSTDGTRVGTEFLVNTRTAGFQSEPTITSLASGGFVVSWWDFSGTPEGTFNSSIKAQLFSPDGTRFGTEFLVSTETVDSQIEPTITGLANGGFVVSWFDAASGTVGDDSGAGIKAQLFSADGAKVGTDFFVSSQTGNAKIEPTITALANGGFVVSWTDFSGTLGDDSGTSIKAQLFAADGARVGNEFLVNTQTPSYQRAPTISDLANGGFVVSWTDFSGMLEDASPTSIKAQLFAADGTRVGTEFLVNTQTASFQTDPTITGLANGGFVVSWRDESGTLGDASGSSIKAQIYVPNEAPTNLLVTPGTPVVENTAIPAGTVRTTFTYRDDAVGTETVTISGTDAALFEVVGNQVRWLAGTTPDFEAKTRYEFTINVDDPTIGTGPELSQLVTIDVTDVNEAPAITSGEGGTTDRYIVPETSGLVTRLTASDPDAGAVLTWSIDGGDDKDAFSIDPITGLLVFVSPRDYEAPTDSNRDNSYDVIVKVSDGVGGSDTQRLSVNIFDIPEAPSIPLFTEGDDIVTLPVLFTPVNALGGNDVIKLNFGIPTSIDGGPGLDHLVLGGVSSGSAQIFRPNSTDPTGQIFRLYDGILGRDPDPIGFAYWVDQLDQGRQLTSVASEMLRASEMTPRWSAGITDAQFVTLAYANVLERAPTSIEASTLTSDLAGGLARSAALVRLTESAEETDGGRLDAVVISGLGGQRLSNVERVVFTDGIVALDIDRGQTTGVIARLYDMAFDRAGDREGLTYWTREADGGRSAIDIAGAFVASPEGASLASLSNADFVTALYNRGLDRAPDAGGLAYWTGRVATDGRALVLAEMSESPEHVGLVDNRIDAPLPLLDRYLVPGV